MPTIALRDDRSGRAGKHAGRSAGAAVPGVARRSSIRFSFSIIRISTGR
jgi:hypothetical protein